MVIIEGLLRLRATLRQAGLDRGFQWVNGSFTEDVETEQRRAPNDIDVAGWNSFLDTETLFPLFGLPLKLPA
jgi:hypothetical protein